MWYIQTTARRKGEMLPFATTWLDLETVMLSEIGQTEIVKNHTISLVWDIKLKATNEHPRKTKTKLLNTRNSTVVTRRKGVGWT